MHFGYIVVRVLLVLISETEADFVRGMHYPVRWDPFFTDFMTLEDVYHFPTQHFDLHARQLTLGDPERSPT